VLHRASLGAVLAGVSSLLSDDLDQSVILCKSLSRTGLQSQRGLFVCSPERIGVLRQWRSRRLAERAVSPGSSAASESRIVCQFVATEQLAKLNSHPFTRGAASPTACFAANSSVDGSYM